MKLLQNPHALLSLARSHAKRQLNVRKWSAPLFLYTFDLEMCFAPQRRALFQHLNFQKCSAPCVLHCFVHFDFDMCFGPQRRALFRHVNFQKCSERGVFCTFWLGNVLRATTACNFFDASTSKRVRNHLARWKIKNCMPCGAKHKMFKAPHARSTFRNGDVQKVHAVVARSTCPS